MCYFIFMKNKFETKNDKFKRLALLRVNKALKAIELISNLSNQSNYEYSDQDAEKIILALNQAVTDLKIKFKPKRKTFKI